MIEAEFIKLWLATCESPIELSFAEALLRADVDVRLVLPDRSWFDMPAHGRDLLIAEAQYHDPPYRLDFLLSLRRGESLTTVVVEADGHDFHERTKEQARRDRSRDRTLTAKGASVLRFTGSEIYRDADACVAEVMDFLRKQLEGRR